MSRILTGVFFTISLVLLAFIYWKSWATWSDIKDVTSVTTSSITVVLGAFYFFGRLRFDQVTSKDKRVRDLWSDLLEVFSDFEENIISLRTSAIDTGAELRKIQVKNQLAGQSIEHYLEVLQEGRLVEIFEIDYFIKLISNVNAIYGECDFGTYSRIDHKFEQSKYSESLKAIKPLLLRRITA